MAKRFPISNPLGLFSCCPFPLLQLQPCLWCHRNSWCLLELCGSRRERHLKGNHKETQFSWLVIPVIRKRQSSRRANADSSNLPSDLRNDLKFLPLFCSVGWSWSCHGHSTSICHPQEISAYLSNKCWISLLIPRMHPPGAAKGTSLRTQKTQGELPGAEQPLPIEMPPSGRISSLPVPFWRIWGADQARFPAVSFRLLLPRPAAAKGLGVHKTELPLVWCPERTEGFSPAVQSLAFPSAPSFCREAKAARSR